MWYSTWICKKCCKWWRDCGDTHVAVEWNGGEKVDEWVSQLVCMQCIIWLSCDDCSNKHKSVLSTLINIDICNYFMSRCSRMWVNACGEEEKWWWCREILVWSRILALCFSCAYHARIHEIIMKGDCIVVVIWEYVISYGIYYIGVWICMMNGGNGGGGRVK